MNLKNSKNIDGSKMKKHQELIDASAKEQGVSIDWETFEKMAVSGFNSEVFEVESNGGTLIIHISKLSNEHIRQDTTRKKVEIAKFLEGIGNIPSAKILSWGKLNKRESFTVQEKLPGKNLGKRSLEGDNIVDELLIGNKEIMLPKVNTIINEFHGINFGKYGWLKLIDGKLEGTYDSWLSFLREEADIWIKNILLNSDKGWKIEKEEIIKIKEEVNLLFETKNDLFILEKPVFIHGDIVNLSNVLVKDEEVTGVLDFEWAMAGDPTWEFAYICNPDIERYFLKSERAGHIDLAQLRDKVKVYKVLFLIWGVNEYADGQDLKRVLFGDLLKALEAAII